MNDRGCLARAALRTDLHLACVDGPDVGLALAPGVVGRAGDIPLSSASIAREHAIFSTTNGKAVLRSVGSSSIRRVSRLRVPLPARDGRALGPGATIRLGEDTFEVRPRPRRLTWPGSDRPGRGVFKGFSLLRVLPLVSAILMLALMAWRLRAMSPRPALLLPLAGCFIAALLGAAIALAFRAHRRRLGWDGAALSLVLASLPASADAPRSLRAPVWPGRASTLRRRLTLVAPVEASYSAGASSIGVVGAHAAQCALWCAGQVAAQAGGARVWWNCAAPVLLGHAGVTIHVSDRETCPHCSSAAKGNGPVLHIGYASRVADLPSWCAQVCVTDDQPVAANWWWTVTRMDRRDALPSRVDWDPSSVHAQAGTLSVPIGQSESGRVDLDLVSDGPHALVAGCTGSGKSEALIVWLAAIAYCYSPERVRFVLIDYKGGSTFARLKELPHTQVLLTDLDAGATSRALDGIAHVLRQREESLHELGFPDLATWELRYDADPHSVPSPPARLIIAIDEFRVLSQTHPASMEVLLRLAAQGRSLGLHLIAATQRPSGAVSAQMRANMDIRLALRCLSAADSTDILEDARAASLPRIPGRAVLAGVGTIQLTYMPDAASVVSSCMRAWPGASAAPLWAPPLPENLTWEDVDAAPPPPATPAFPAAAGSVDSPAREHAPVGLGLVEGIEGHQLVSWDGGSIQIQTSAHEAALASCWVVSIASRIARITHLPLHVIGEARIPGAASHLPEEDPAVIDVLEEACEHGPLILAITDVPALRSALTHALTEPGAQALWTSLLGRARRANVVIVAAYAGRFTPSSAALGAFAMRLVRARDADEALHAGIAPADLRALGEHQALLARPGEPTLLACFPTASALLNEGAKSDTPCWRIPSLTQAATMVSSAAFPVLIGPEHAPPSWQEIKPWIVIGQERDTRTVRAIHEALGWAAPRITDVIPEAAWTRITRWDDHRVLALNPSDNVIRALIHSSRRHPSSIAARRWSPSCGLICEGGTLTTIQLTDGSVNT